MNNQLNRERAQPSFVLDEEVAGRESTYQATINKSPKGKSGISTSKDFGEVMFLSSRILADKRVVRRRFCITRKF